YAGLTATAILTVTHGPTPTGLTLAPERHTLAAGDGVVYSLTARDAYSNPWDVTASGSYTIPPGAGGTWAGNIYTAEAAGAWTVTATYAGLTATAALTVVHRPALSGLTLDPEHHTLAAGEGVAYNLTARDIYSNPWDVTASGSYTISPGAGGGWAGNMYTAEAAGAWTVTATYAGLTATAALTVAHGPTPTGLTLAPERHTLAAGDGVVYSLTARDIYSNPWDVTASGSYTISPGAGGGWAGNMYTAEAAGAWTVTATYAGLTATAALTVAHGPTPVGLSLTPERHAIAAGDGVAYSLTACDVYSNSWDVSASGSYTISPDAGGWWARNVYTAEAAGAWTVTATYAGLTATAALTVVHGPTLARLTLDPEGHTLAAGDGVVYSLTARDAYSNPWDVTASGSYTISPDAGGTWAGNVYTAEAAGAWTVTATYAGLTATAALTVAHGPTPVGLALAPGRHTLAAGDSVIYSLTACDVYSNAWDVTASGSYTISPDAGGTWAGNVYTAEAAGAWTVTATYAGLTATAVLTVAHGPTPVRLALAPERHTLSAGDGVAYSLTARDAYSNPWDVTASGSYTVSSGAGGGWAGNIYTAEAAGAWTVTATYAGLTATAVLTVTALPVAGFTYAPMGGICLGHVVRFTDTSSSNTEAWTWAFGDGFTATVQHPQHTYAAARSFTVVLTATNAQGSAVATDTITVTAAPAVTITYSPMGDICPMTEVSFQAVNRGGSASYQWRLDDTVVAAGQFVSHTYSLPGLYTIWLTATNGCGTSVVSTTIRVGSSPRASFDRVPAGDVVSGNTVRFLDTSTGDPTAWLWSFGDGETTNVQHPTHIYIGPGTFTAVLTVTNACGVDRATQVIPVVPQCQGASITALTASSPGVVGQAVHFTATVSGDAPIIYTWTFGDATPPLAGENLPTVSHIYTRSSIYTAELALTNACGEAQKVLPVTIVPTIIYLPLVMRY
ncbi:MAG TPA: PKD domain-containing protein, partial [Chloroflexi bacterium]|nr:PKD domain-containing protein [Chloroflexota bacterium]